VSWWLLVNDPLDAYFFSMYLFQFSTCFEQTPCPSSEKSIVSIQYLVHVTLCRWPFRVQVLFDLHTKRSPTQSDIYHRLYWNNWFSWWWARGCSKHVENWNKSDIYHRLHWNNWFSWWWARGCSKHVENWNKYIEKKCASSWSFTKNHNEMHRQQNIKVLMTVKTRCTIMTMDDKLAQWIQWWHN